MAYPFTTAIKVQLKQKWQIMTDQSCWLQYLYNLNYMNYMLSWCCMFVQVDIIWRVSKSSMGLVFLGSLILQKRRQQMTSPVLTRLFRFFCTSHRRFFQAGSGPSDAASCLEAWNEVWGSERSFLQFLLLPDIKSILSFFFKSNTEKSFNYRHKCRKVWYQEEHPNKYNSHFQASIW